MDVKFVMHRRMEVGGGRTHGTMLVLHWMGLGLGVEYINWNRIGNVIKNDTGLKLNLGLRMTIN